MSSQSLTTTRNFASSTSRKSHFETPEGRQCVLRTIRLIKTSLPPPRPRRFLDAKEVQHDFAWPIDTLTHRFIDFNQVVFCGD
jgi:hypothetical protein